MKRVISSNNDNDNGFVKIELGLYYINNNLYLNSPNGSTITRPPVKFYLDEDNDTYEIAVELLENSEIPLFYENIKYVENLIIREFWL